MNITEITTTTTFEEIEKALGQVMETNDQLGAFSRVEILGVNFDTKTMDLKFFKKGRRGPRTTTQIEGTDTEDTNTSTTNTDTERSENE